jgi:hypothetical protein
VTATGNRDKKEIRTMSGPMSERAPDITVEADGRAESTTVLACHGRPARGPVTVVPLKRQRPRSVNLNEHLAGPGRVA